MVEITPLENTSSLDKPRRIMRYLLVYCTSGKFTMAVDEKELVVNTGEVITITSGQIHWLKNWRGAKGYLLEFSLDFFCKDDKDIELIFHNGLFCHFARNEIISVNSTIMENHLNAIYEEQINKPYQYLISIHSRIELILVEINRAKVKRGDEIWKPDALFLKFLEAVRSNFEHNFRLSHFAEILGTTEPRLNDLAKIHTGKTAQNVIYGLIASEAKRLLTYENYAVKAVAYKLGFNDPFYFSNFFKKHSGISPKSYQNKFSL